jgi:TPR repeat protein
MFERGKGFTKDYAEAYFWYSLSSAAGDKGAAKMTMVVAKSLTHEQIAAIKKRVEEWKSNHAQPAAPAKTETTEH